jgi:tetratricopeptide (TPR) repeat protein
LCESALLGWGDPTSEDDVRVLAHALRRACGHSGEKAHAWKGVPALAAAVSVVQDPDLTQLVFSALSTYYMGIGDLQQAEQAVLACLAVIDEHPPLSARRAAAIGDLGVVKHLRGDLAGAERAYRESLAVGYELGAPERWQITGRLNLAEALLDQGQAAEAKQVLTDGLSRTGIPRLRRAIALTLLVEALWCLDLKDAAVATELELLDVIPATTDISYALDRLKRSTGRDLSVGGPAPVH